MQQIILPSTPITSENYHNFMEQGTFDDFKLKNGLTTDIIPANRLYLSTGMCKGQAITHTDLKMLGPEENKKIKMMIDTYGEDVTMAMAEVFSTAEKTTSDAAMKFDTNKASQITGVAGAITTVVSNKKNAIIQGMEEVRELVEKYYKGLKENWLGPRGEYLGKLRIQEKIKNVNDTFHNELQIQVSKRKQLKVSNLTETKFSIKNLPDLKHISSFGVQSRRELKNLENMTKFLKLTDSGLIFLDFGIRSISVYQDYKHGKNVGQSVTKNTAGFFAGSFLVGAAFRTLAGVATAAGSAEAVAAGGLAVAGGVVLSGPILVLSLALGALILYKSSDSIVTEFENAAGNFFNIVNSYFNL